MSVSQSTGSALDIPVTGRNGAIYAALRILRRPGIEAHVYTAGANGAVINALQSNNYTLSDGSTGLSAVDGSAGLVLDGMGSVGAELSSFPYVARGTVSGTTQFTLTTTSVATTEFGIVVALPALVVAAGKSYRITSRIVSKSVANPLQTLIAYTSADQNAGVGAQMHILTAGGHSSVYAPASTSTITLRTEGGTATIGDTWDIEFSVKPYSGIHATQSTAGNRPAVQRGAFNLLLNSSALSTQGVTCIAAPYTLAFTGTGIVTLSGASTAGPLVGTGASNRVSLTFTPTAGVVTFTVSGSVTLAQLEIGSTASAYSPTTGAAASNPTAGRYSWQFDGANDSLALGSAPWADASTDHVLIAGGRPDSTAAERYFAGISGASTANPLCPLLVWGSDNRLKAYWRNDAGTLVEAGQTGTVQTTSAPHIATAFMRSNVKQIRVDGITQSGSDSSVMGATTLTHGMIGAFANSAANAAGLITGNISIVIAIKGTLSDSDMLTLERFAASTLPSGPRF